MKHIYFLCGLPRCGNTLLASILNQNSNITVTAHSIGAEILYNLEKIKQIEIFNNFPNHQSLNNLISKSLYIYYKDHNSKYIIDRGPWGTPKNIELIKKYVTPNPKFIILERPLVEILASFVKVKGLNKKQAKDFCKHEITQGITAGYCYAIYNIFQNKNNFIKIQYDDLIKNTERNIEKIYKFLDISTYNHRYTNLDQLSINNTLYDDDVLDGTYHLVKNKIEKNNYDLNDYLAKETIEKYKNLSIEKVGKSILNNKDL